MKIKMIYNTPHHQFGLSGSNQGWSLNSVYNKTENKPLYRASLQEKHLLSGEALMCWCANVNVSKKLKYIFLNILINSDMNNV